MDSDYQKLVDSFLGLQHFENRAGISDYYEPGRFLYLISNTPTERWYVAELDLQYSVLNIYRTHDIGPSSAINLANTLLRTLGMSAIVRDGSIIIFDKNNAIVWDYQAGGSLSSMEILNLSEHFPWVLDRFVHAEIIPLGMEEPPYGF